MNTFQVEQMFEMMNQMKNQLNNLEKQNFELKNEVLELKKLINDKKINEQVEQNDNKNVVVKKQSKKNTIRSRAFEITITDQDDLKTFDQEDNYKYKNNKETLYYIYYNTMKNLNTIQAKFPNSIVSKPEKNHAFYKKFFSNEIVDDFEQKEIIQEIPKEIVDQLITPK